MRQETFELLDRIRFNQEMKTKPESHYTLRDRLILRGWAIDAVNELIHNLYGRSDKTFV